MNKKISLEYQMYKIGISYIYNLNWMTFWKENKILKYIEYVNHN